VSCEWLDAALFCCLQHSDLNNKIHIRNNECVRYRNVEFKMIIILWSGHFTLKVISCFSVVLEVYWLFRCMYVFDSQRCAEAIRSHWFAHLPDPYYIQFPPSVAASVLKMEAACTSETFASVYFSHIRIPCFKE
jgi:hypothetical protein